ncbi:MAG: hypothetical protein LIO65_00180 [Odoribacter sp.]|nr:hypothetical protein [Odoribacter sp.]
MKRYILILCAFALISCKENYTPKPYGYFRIDLPEKSYTLFQEDMPYYFQIASHAETEPDNSDDAEPFWINIVYPQYNAKINLSYKPILTDTSLAFFNTIAIV